MVFFAFLFGGASSTTTGDGRGDLSRSVNCSSWDWCQSIGAKHYASTPSAGGESLYSRDQSWWKVAPELSSRPGLMGSSPAPAIRAGGEPLRSRDQGWWRWLRCPLRGDGACSRPGSGGETGISRDPGGWSVYGHHLARVRATNPRTGWATNPRGLAGRPTH
jgi:hypothetical protein